MRKKGFTLVELLIVIAIIGILASIIVVGTDEIKKKARDTKRLANLRSIQTALEMYKDANGGYPCQGSIYYDGARHIKWNESATYDEITKIHSVNADWIGAYSDEEELENGRQPLSDFLLTVPLDPINIEDPSEPDYRYAYASIDGKDYKIIAYNMESKDGQNKAANDGGITGKWAGERKYELFSPGGQWYIGELSYPILDPSGKTITECLCTGKDADGNNMTCPLS